MKKNLLLVLFIMVSAVSSAQFTVWEDDFDDADASDWILLDKDGNGSNWIARKNIKLDENNAIVDGNASVLGTYNIDLATASPLETLEDNLAISPVLDLSFYSGAVSLILNAQPSAYDSNQELSVYGSTSPDPATFTLIGKIMLERLTIDEPEFKDYSINISQFSGQSTVYIALGNNTTTGFIGYEIDKVSVNAQALLGLDDVASGAAVCKMNQNPVQEYLQLELGEQFQAEEATLKIYNFNGVLVKETPYKKDNLSVSELAQGVYFLLVSDNNRTAKLKFIKK
ncbi:T9SS type A sorting domain-containing protein [Flavobacterium aquidurense]|nr:T9SS type A sorting domain-containing protein [Flavobacterium aquidurense]